MTLSAEQVFAIESRLAVRPLLSRRAIAAELNVSRGSIEAVARGKHPRQAGIVPSGVEPAPLKVHRDRCGHLITTDVCESCKINRQLGRAVA